MKRTNQMSESLRLGMLLAVSGGFMDAYSYLLRDHVFANAQTGNILLFGVHLSEGNFGAAARYFLPVFAFAAGIALAELVRLVGRERLVLDLSCRFREGQYYIVTNRWQKFTRHTVEGSLLRELADSAAEFLIHAVDVEGRQTGIDHRLLELLAAESPIDCVYAGGIASFEDIAVIEKAGRGRIHYTIGSALDLFGGPLSYQEVVAHAALPPDSSGCD